MADLVDDAKNLLDSTIDSRSSNDSRPASGNPIESDLGPFSQQRINYSPLYQTQASLNDDEASSNDKLSVNRMNLNDTDAESSKSNRSNSFKLAEKEFDESEIEQQLQAVSGEEQQQQQAKTSDTDGESDEAINYPLEMNEEWRSKFKHLFILSEAGKPIYSLHGNEVELITFMGLVQALISIIECDNENKLKFIVAGEHKFVFLHRTHLIFVCVSKEYQKCVEQLELELNYVYNQIISVTTLTLIEKIFSRHHNYDLRNKLTGTEKLLTNIVGRFNDDYGMFLNCVNSYPMQSEMREQIAKMIASNISALKNVLFGLLLFDNRLITLIRPKSKNIHPVDIHLLVNVITGFDTPKTADFTWYPICLPHFDSSGIMYAYISHLDPQCNTCLILLTGVCDQEQSTEINECRKRIQQKLNSLGFLQSLNLNINNRDNSLKLDQIGVAELKHFLFKDNKAFQYFSSDFALPYTNDADQRQRLFNTYQRLYYKLHNATNSLKIIYAQQNTESVLGWMTTDFEIYSTFSPLVNKEQAINAINKLLDFIRKNKSKIFLNSTPTLSR